MRRVAILQARMTSSRLPGKVLADLDGVPMLAQEVRRLRRATQLDAIVIATTANTTDDPLVDLAEREGVEVFRGDEHDVLGRFLGAARMVQADLVVRITGDCPLIDPVLVDRVITRSVDPTDPCDYASNTVERSYPRGLDTEVFHRDVLERIARLGRSDLAREHVTYFLHRERPDLFEIRQVTRENDASDLRWTVDTAEDLELVRRMYAELGAAHASTDELIDGVRARSDLLALNRDVAQKRA